MDVNWGRPWPACQLFRLLCCPPLPSRIAAKLAFRPPEPSYTIEPTDDASTFTFRLTERAEWHHSRRRLEAIEVFQTTSSRGSLLTCMFLRYNAAAPFTLFISHGSRVDLGLMVNYYRKLATLLRCHVFSYDYTGYGTSYGRLPSEMDMYADTQAAWEALLARYYVRAEQVILYGMDIGTAATVDLACRIQAAGVILHTPIASGLRVVFPSVSRTWCFDAFASIDKIVRVRSPVLLIHGVDDQVVPFTHALAMHARCRQPSDPLWVEGGGHDSLEVYGLYTNRLKLFVWIELFNLPRRRGLPPREPPEPYTELSQLWRPAS